MKIGEVEGGLRKLGARRRDTGDRVYTVRCDCGMWLGWTKLSRQPRSRDLGPSLARLIPQQLNVDAAMWADIAGCTKGRDEYLVARGHAH